jgi:hypothetical protein
MQCYNSYIEKNKGLKMAKLNAETCTKYASEVLKKQGYETAKILGNELGSFDNGQEYLAVIFILNGDYDTEFEFKCWLNGENDIYGEW